jgi:beta-glucosidase
MAAAVGWFADPIFLGRESHLMREMLGDRLPTFTEEEWELLRDSSDFYGCNTCKSIAALGHMIIPVYPILTTTDTTNYIKPGPEDVSLGNSELSFENSKGESLGQPCKSFPFPPPHMTY